MRKPELIVLYGGQSSEHDISCVSARFVLASLNREEIDIKVVGIGRCGGWFLQNLDDSWWVDGEEGLPLLCQDKLRVAPLGGSCLDLKNIFSKEGSHPIVFPVLHGPLGEDGTVQGLLELANLPFIGCGSLASAMSMDKEVTKKMAIMAGVRVAPFLTLKSEDWPQEQENVIKKVENRLGLPLFVKPCSQGSSYGISKVESIEELSAACDLALQYDDKILLEKALVGRELEMAVLFDGQLTISDPGEVVTFSEFYSFEAKYKNNDGAKTLVKADLTKDEIEGAHHLAVKMVQELQLWGLARIDVFYDDEASVFYLNEVNTMPGLTPSSLYPAMMQQAGICRSSLIQRLMKSAVFRWEKRKQFKI